MISTGLMTGQYGAGGGSFDRQFQSLVVESREWHGHMGWMGWDVRSQGVQVVKDGNFPSPTEPTWQLASLAPGLPTWFQPIHPWLLGCHPGSIGTARLSMALS